jgi:pimeloyl-ACP methyl ester carboxylesterase
MVRGKISKIGTPPPVRTQRVPGFGDVQLTIDFVGDERGQPVVLLHGGGQTRYAWGAAALALAKRGYQAIVLDLRGHGDSDWSATLDYSINAYVADVMSVIRDLAVAPVIIGASMGGQIALVTAAEHPSRVRALVLVDVTPQVDRDGRARIVAFMKSRPLGFAHLEEAADAIAEYLPHRPRPTDLSGLKRNLRLREDGRYHWHWDQRFLLTYEPDVDEAERRHSDAARKIRIPTLLLRGSRSEVVTMDNVRHFQTLMPHAEFVDVSGAAHMIAGDRNDAFNSAVIEFLERTVES